MCWTAGRNRLSLLDVLNLPMSPFFTELKAAREAKGISLAEISDVTLINVKMLESLESGKLEGVPQAYVRAFLREYATVVGIDKDEILRKYEAWQQGKTVPPGATQAGPAIPTTIQPEKKVRSTTEEASRITPKLVKVGIAVAVLVVVDVMFWSVLKKEPAPTVRETPFSEVVKERERRAGLNEATTDANPRVKRSATIASARKDTMTLVATTSDSVWMEIVIDNDVITEHLLRPKTSFSWRARQEFYLSAIGNPTAIHFTLDGKPIAIPIRPGYVTRNVRITRDSIQVQGING